MDIRSVANGVSSVVNDNMAVSVQASTGYTIGAGQRQVPSYAAPVSGFAQIQALDGVELKQLDGMNLEGVLKKIYLRGALAGVVRAQSKGGDKVTVASGPYAGVWLTVKVLEAWPLWTSCAINLQVNP